MSVDKSPASKPEQAFSFSSVFHRMVTWERCLDGSHRMLPPDFWFGAYCSAHLQLGLDAGKMDVLARFQLCADRHLPDHPCRDPVTSGLPQHWHVQPPSAACGMWTLFASGTCFIFSVLPLKGGFNISFFRHDWKTPLFFFFFNFLPIRIPFAWIPWLVLFVWMLKKDFIIALRKGKLPMNIKHAVVHSLHKKPSFDANYLTSQAWP